MSKQAHITLVNGAETSALDIADRGLAYGDGLFETMRIISGRVPLLSLHLARFTEGVRKLQFGHEKKLVTTFKAAVKDALKNLSGEALLKIIVTRGSGGRGYTPAEDSTCNIIVQVFDLPQYPLEYTQSGVTVKECEHRLYHNPVFAGIKHLNRLDQVLASKELDEEAEGLLFDQNELLVEGLKSNILVFQKDRIVTPKLDSCGVKGTLRQFLMQSSPSLGLDIVEADITRQDIDYSQGLAMINSIYGIWPVKSISGNAVPYDERCDQIRSYLQKQLGF